MSLGSKSTRFVVGETQKCFLEGAPNLTTRLAWSSSERPFNNPYFFWQACRGL